MDILNAIKPGIKSSELGLFGGGAGIGMIVQMAGMGDKLPPNFWPNFWLYTMLYLGCRTLIKVVTILKGVSIPMNQTAQETPGK